MRPTEHTTREPTPTSDPHGGEGTATHSDTGDAETPANEAAPQRSPNPDTAGEDTNPGRTTIAPNAVERIATKVVADFATTGGTANQMLGITLSGAGKHQDADVAVRLHGQRAVSLSVWCSVPYPFDVRQATDTLRAELVDRVGALTGMRVQRVDITVTALTTNGGRRVS